MYHWYPIWPKDSNPHPPLVNTQLPSSEETAIIYLYHWNMSICMTHRQYSPYPLSINFPSTSSEDTSTAKLVSLRDLHVWSNDSNTLTLYHSIPCDLYLNMLLCLYYWDPILPIDSYPLSANTQLHLFKIPLPVSYRSLFDPNTTLP